MGDAIAAAVGGWILRIVAVTAVVVGSAAFVAGRWSATPPAPPKPEETITADTGPTN